MKTLEYHYNGDWRDRLLNAWPLCLDALYIGTLAWAWDAEGPYSPEDYSLFYNGFVMVRVTFPFGIFIHIKPARNLRIQCGIGWKLNGRFGILARAQSDESAAAGTHGPNVGQARGWARGTA